MTCERGVAASPGLIDAFLCVEMYKHSRILGLLLNGSYAYLSTLSRTTWWLGLRLGCEPQLDSENLRKITSLYKASGTWLVRAVVTGGLAPPAPASVPIPILMSVLCRNACTCLCFLCLYLRLSRL